MTQMPCFVYGEHIEEARQRSLGYRLLKPAEPATWCAEVEELARRLQAAPYPDHWPPAELFCSVMLSDGQRVVARACYGLADHTPSRRRGGLELIGVVAPGNLGVSSALSIYRWLRKRRAGSGNPDCLDKSCALADVLGEVPPEPAATDPAPVLPIRIWQEGVLLFAAVNPSDPDHRLGLLEQQAGDNWQWLSLTGLDFPLSTYARRGPLIAWTAHLSDVAIKLDRNDSDRQPIASRVPGLLAGALLFLLLGVNLWAYMSLSRQLQSHPNIAPRVESGDNPLPLPAVASDASADRFARALHRLLREQGALPNLDQSRMNKYYHDAATKDRDLQLQGAEGKEVVAAIQFLARRGPDKVEMQVRQALEDKGYDPQLVDLVCRKLRKQLTLEGAE